MMGLTEFMVGVSSRLAYTEIGLYHGRPEKKTQ